MAEHDIIVIGSGSSLGTPLLKCLARNNCKVCTKANIGNPMENKNNRLNPSIILRTKHKGGATRHVLIDATKTFREAAVRWFPKHKINYVDGVILTHEHSDAMLGIDDLRMVQEPKKTLPMFMSEKTYERVEETFAYLINTEPIYLNGIKPSFEPTVADKAKTFTASIQCHVIAKLDGSEIPAAFEVEGVLVQPFPVLHGGENLSLGFIFGRGAKKFVYISDMHDLPHASLELLLSLQIELIILDAIHASKTMYSHQSIKEAVKLGKLLNAETVRLIGMGHYVEHYKTNNFLDRELIDVQLAWDGMEISLEQVKL